ncbi:putative selenium delivery protein YdfZ [Pectobacterium brasiliense]|uniref:putative selenium delivery protein YdfZ n=1 Tax=Pectobacterium brasiliense TaxID=180957 RepID=UPI001CE0D2A4|nr:putative selenium delivery protein YdfZ [Pectobacterium brasiliense]EKV4364560.1 hypothetical protein [Citrobacter freundii]MCA5921949.1 putative selenium delivery protein YdfZ [Pectobacterium brasiliense]MCA5929336.1 putative selenium delivery protein YdfZ [Pectobacterium brasiliense]MCA5937939.1 putative selenium delivery protein YdfZ [Pectobacterium brasiliense]MCA5942230.1 putative selenium delivery protein YdfZ [Pectobacterium brasiliense]
MNRSFDRYYNVIKVGDRVMDSESGSIGYVSKIQSKNMFSLKVRLSDCVKIEGAKCQYSPAKLMKIEKDG